MINYFKLSEVFYAVMRIVAGALFSIHGMQKIFGILGGSIQPFGSQLWFGGMIELVAGLLIVIGLVVRPAAFLASGTMAVAYFQFHFWPMTLDSNFFPVVNGGEKAVLFCFIFLYMSAKGAGIWSVDTLLSKNSAASN